MPEIHRPESIDLHEKSSFLPIPCPYANKSCTRVARRIAFSSSFDILRARFLFKLFFNLFFSPSPSSFFSFISQFILRNTISLSHFSEKRIVSSPWRKLLLDYFLFFFFLIGIWVFYTILIVLGSVKLIRLIFDIKSKSIIMKQTEHFLSNLILTLSANLIIPLPPSLRLMKLSRNYESNTVAVVSLLCNYWDITDSRNFHAEMKSRNLAARNSSAMIGGDPSNRKGFQRLCTRWARKTQTWRRLLCSSGKLRVRTWNVPCKIANIVARFHCFLLITD